MIGLVLVLLLALPAALAGQVVRGVVRDSVSGTPAGGVLVALVDGASGERRTVLTDETGRFSVAAAGAGTFTVETKRIGVRPAVTAAFGLAAGETREIDLAVSAVIPRLATMRVRSKAYCADRLREGGETASLWEEARAALTATLITRQQRTFQVTISRFRRTYHPRRLEVQSEDRTELSGLATNPFRSVPMSVLAAKGYVVDDGSGTFAYHAPDVDVLLSGMFVRDHCFWLVEGRDSQAGRVGVAFRPTSARRVPDIEGVLWLDGATRELRRLEFNYTSDPYEGLWQRFPSYVEYTRLPSGAWIIQRWAIRMPLVDVSRPDPTIPGANAGGPTRRLVAILEQGAEASIGDAGLSRTTHALAGVAFDSIARAPLAGARVSLRGTPFAATSDADGRFRIQLPDTGTYLLAFEHPRLDSVAYDVPARAVRVADTLVVADVAVPPTARVRAALCPDSRGVAVTGVVIGAVRTPSGTAAAWTTLRYRWSRYEPADARGGATRPSESAPVLQSAPGATLVTDSRGRLLICDVPPGRYRLSLEGETGNRAETDLLLNGGEILVREVTLGTR